MCGNKGIEFIISKCSRKSDVLTQPLHDYWHAVPNLELLKWIFNDRMNFLNFFGCSVSRPKESYFDTVKKKKKQHSKLLMVYTYLHFGPWFSLCDSRDLPWNATKKTHKLPKDSKHVKTQINNILHVPVPLASSIQLTDILFWPLSSDAF